MGVQDWASLAGAFGAGGGVSTVAKFVWRKIANNEEANLVDALRRALDKGRLREDALAQVLGVLIFGLRHIEELSPVVSDAIERAVQILETAQNRLRDITNGVAQ